MNWTGDASGDGGERALRMAGSVGTVGWSCAGVSEDTGSRGGGMNESVFASGRAKLEGTTGATGARASELLPSRCTRKGLLAFPSASARAEVCGDSTFSPASRLVKS